MKMKKISYLVGVLVLAVVVMGVVVTRPVNALTVDVNPSIEIVTNRFNQVLEINPVNGDAKELLEDFQPKNKNLEDTVNDLVDLMILTGHIEGGADNFVMITVDDKSINSDIVQRVNKAIAAMLQNKKIEATVLNQTVEKGQEKENKTGVQLAAERLTKFEEGLDIDDVGDMTVRELVNYSKDNNIPLEDIFKTTLGEVKAKNISPDQAKKIALDKVGGGTVVEFEMDDNEYEIEIKYNNAEYELEIDLYTGEIKEYDVDYDEYDKEKTVKKEEKKSRKRISIDEAKRRALAKVGGGTIVEFEMDDDEYEIEIEYNGYEYELELDLYTGEILDFDKDRMDD